LSLRGDFGLGFLSNAGTDKTLGTLEDGLNTFCIEIRVQGKEGPRDKMYPSRTHSQ
jgi:hypothetical protein